MDKEFDDQVYEDEYYKENYDEEELKEDDNADEDHEDDSEHEQKIHVSFACEECDYRWDDVVIKIKGNLEDEQDEFDAACPMCGALNVSQI